MKKIIIVCGHGNYASGIQSTLELLAGKNEDLYYVDFTADDNDETLREKFATIIEKNKDLEMVFVCDIIGGTPFKIAAELCNSSKEMELVAGCNVGGILETIFTKDDISLAELADSIVEASKNSTLRFKKIDVNAPINMNVSEEDGI